MLKTVIFGAAFVVASVVSSMASSNLFNEAIAPVVKIDNDCSAVAINEGDKNDVYLLTAKHCVADSEKKSGHVNIDVMGKDHKPVAHINYIYDVVARDWSSDLALLKVRDPLFVPQKAEIAKKITVQEGDPVWVVGYPLAWTRTVTQGNFNGRMCVDQSTGQLDTDYCNVQSYLKASPNITGGNSGGGLFQKNADGHFELIGTTSMGVTGSGWMTSFLNLFVPLENIQSFVDETLKNTSITTQAKKGHM